MESATDGFWGVFFVLLVLAIQVGTAVGFVWIVVYFATRNRVAETDARLRALEQRVEGIERSTAMGSDPE